MIRICYFKISSLVWNSIKLHYKHIYHNLSRKSESHNDHEKEVEEKIKQQTKKNAYF